MGTKIQLVYLLAVAFMWQTISTSSNENQLGLESENSKSSQSLGDQRSALSPHSLGSYENEFLEKLLDEYGTDGVVSMKQLKQLVINIKMNLDHSSHEKHKELESSSSPGKADLTPAPPPPKAAKVEVRCSEANECKSNKCLSMPDIFRHHSLSSADTLNDSTLQRISPTILYQLQNPACGALLNAHNAPSKRPSPAAVWGFSFLCVTLINLCALMGMVFLPLMGRSFYKNMLLFMVALAVGTLTGSGLLFLIPESFEMTSPDSPHADYYIWRCMTIIGGIYLFFLVERLLKMIMKFKQDPGDVESSLPCLPEGLPESQNAKEKEEMEDLPIASVPTHSVHLEESMNMSFKPIPNKVSGEHRKVDCLLPKDSSPEEPIANRRTSRGSSGILSLQNGQGAVVVVPEHGHSHGAKLSEIRSVAWMVIFGDGLHNFIDGLSIGAAFSGSIMTGFSVALAVICEELPHELGDFAILLNAGMSMRQALSYNFLSACMCYLGLIAGILIGETTTGAVYIFALAGGMFLYIALVDMLPEVNHAADEEEAATGATWSIFMLQNAGLLAGIGIMLLLAVFSGKIDLTHLE